MAKRRRYSASKCPEPINTMIDLAGALAMGAYTRHKIISDYKRGQGAESIRAASTVLGIGAMRRGSDGMLALGGLYGVNSAIRDIERSERQARLRRPVYDDGINFPPYKTNDNRYAWRLNCEDGSAWGISPLDYETRDAYNQALNAARGGQPQEAAKAPAPEPQAEENPFQGSPLLCCRVSRLDNGANDYYLTDDDSIKVGDTITVQTELGTSEGIVIAVKKLSEMKPEDFPAGNMWILTQEDDGDPEKPKETL